MAAPDDGKLVKSREIAALLEVHPKQIYRLLKQGMPARRVGGEWRFHPREVLAWAHARGGSNSNPAHEIKTASPLRALLAANGEVVVRVLLAHLQQSPSAPLWGFVQSDRAQAIAWLAEARVDAAGSHGDVPPTRLGDARVRLARIHLVQREVGLVAPRGQRVPSLDSLPERRLASRPATAGVVHHLDAALRRARVDVASVQRRALELDSHQSVIEAVLTGAADVGLTTHASAARYGLSFRALATEDYGLLVRSESLGAPAIVHLCEVAQSTALRAALDALAGCDARDAGAIRYDPE